MCDLECIEDHGDYKAVVTRLERLTNDTLALSSIDDHVEQAAWVQHYGQIALVAALTPSQHREFVKLTGIAMTAVK